MIKQRAGKDVELQVSELIKSEASKHRHGFGSRLDLYFPQRLANRVEYISFEKNGNDHSHDVIEIAVCLEGSGLVVVEEINLKGKPITKHEVVPGSMVLIPSECKHHMEPGWNSPLKMLILYEWTR